MTDPRAVLDVIRQRADNATDGPWAFQHWGSKNQNGDYAESILFDGDGETSTYGLADSDGEFIAASRTDVPRLVAALTAALDLADSIDDRDDLYATQEVDNWPGGQIVINAVPVHELRAAITDALTPKGNDS